MKKEMDLHGDYLPSSFGQVTATGLSNLLDGALPHDEITRMPALNNFTSSVLWAEVKPFVGKYESEDACPIFDDTFASKPYTDENDVIAWHRDHGKGRNEKGIDLLTALYHTRPVTEAEALRVPVAFECVKKTLRFRDVKTRKEKRQSPTTENETMRSMLPNAVASPYPIFRCVSADGRFSSSDNMPFIHKPKKYFVTEMKSNRPCMFSSPDGNRGRRTSSDKLPLQAEQPVEVWIKNLETEVLSCKFVFTNKDGSTGETYPPNNDSELSADGFKTLYKKRRSVEECHKSPERNASLAKSPARTVTTQTNRLFASPLACIKLEKLKFVRKLNHFALKAEIYFGALKSARKELMPIKN